MRKSIFFTILAFAAFSCFIRAEAQTISRISPTEGNAGMFVQIHGSDFGDEQGDKLVTMTLAGGSLGPMPLEVFSWSGGLIEVRIPGPDDAEHPYSLGTSPVSVEIRVIDPAVPPAEGREFRILPSTWVGSAPFLRRLEPHTVSPAALSTDAGRIVKIYGSRFPLSQGDYTVYVGRGSAEVVSWSSTLVTMRVPPGLEEGEHATRLARPDPSGTGTVGSNTIYLTIGTEAIPGPATVGEAGPRFSMDDSMWAGIGIPASPICHALHAEAAPSSSDWLCSIPLWSRPSISSVVPSISPPGSYLEIKGRCWGETAAGKNVTIRGVGFSSPADLDVVSWSNNRIVARLPGPDKILPDGTISNLYLLGDATLRTSIEVRQGDAWTTNAADFLITPYALSDPPIVCCLDAYTIEPGSCVNIYGSGFGPKTDTSQVNLERADGAFLRSVNAAWTSSQIRYCIPEGQREGSYKFYVTRPDASGRVLRSNSLDIRIMTIMRAYTPSASIPTRPPKVEMAPMPPQEMQRKPPRLEVKPYTQSLQPMGVGSDKNKTDSSNTLGTPPSSSSDKKPK